MAKKESFKAYVLKQKPDKSPVGDFIRETKADESFPRRDKWQEIRFYLIRRDGGDKSVIAARSLWKAQQKL